MNKTEKVAIYYCSNLEEKENPSVELDELEICYQRAELLGYNRKNIVVYKEKEFSLLAQEREVLRDLLLDAFKGKVTYVIFPSFQSTSPVFDEAMFMYQHLESTINGIHFANVEIPRSEEYKTLLLVYDLLRNHGMELSKMI